MHIYKITLCEVDNFSNDLKKDILIVRFSKGYMINIADMSVNRGNIFKVSYLKHNINNKASKVNDINHYIKGPS